MLAPKQTQALVACTVRDCLCVLLLVCVSQLIQHHGIDPLSEQSTINDPALLMEMLSARYDMT